MIRDNFYFFFLIIYTDLDRAHRVQRQMIEPSDQNKVKYHKIFPRRDLLQALWTKHTSNEKKTVI